ncbi:MAG: carboxymuconolactone decarboxylase family protein [Candidatus Moraniibacteriota bacterium]|jgi:AhpD family alkylhydroperoxidase
MSTDPIVKCVSSDELHGDAKKIFEDFLDSSGKVPKWLQVMGNCEDTMTGFFSLFKSVMDNEPAPSELKWKVAYVVSDINKCEFCIGATQSKLSGLGISAQDLENVDKAEDPKEALAIEYARATTEHAYSIDPELTKRMQDAFSDEEIVEITAVIGTFNFLNRFNDALRILPESK